MNFQTINNLETFNSDSSSKQPVLITGASRGIGKAIAVKFASEGHPVAINSHSSATQLKQLKEYIENTFKVPCVDVCGDISDSDFVEKMFFTVTQQIGDIEILINNAGISHIGLLSDMSYEEWDKIINTNLSSCFYCCKNAIPPMVRKQSGKIINISSVWGICGASCEAAYSASKGGINALTKALGKELAPSNIQVNAIACGVIDTDMNKCFTEKERIDLAEEIPAGRFALPQEVAELAFSIASGHNYLTSQIITLDGGWI